MASRIVGIDVGAYSVKAAIATPAFRGAAVSEFVEMPVPAGDEPFLERAVSVVGHIVREYDLAQDTHYVSVSGDHLFVHVLEFPFKSLRRADLEKAVGAELESILPIDLDELVFAFEEISTKPVEGAEDTAGMRVLACAMPRDYAEQFIEELQGQGIEAKGLVAAPESYPRVLKKIGRETLEPLAVVDIGHVRTNVCVVRDGKVVFARTVARGGRDLTLSIARNWRLPFAEAENAKHQDGFVASSGQPPPTEAWQRIHDALSGEIIPLGRDLRRTLMACRNKTGIAVSEILLVGGGSRVRGLPEFLSETLQLRVNWLTEAEVGSLLGAPGARGGDVAALSVGIALEGATGRPVFDLRRGDLAVKADLSALRAKAGVIAACAVMMLAFAVVAGFSKMRTLRASEKILTKRMVVETTEVFGEPITAQQARGRIGPTGPTDSPMPHKSAYQLLLAVNESLPPSQEVDLDVRDITIKAGSLRADVLSRPKGDADAAAAITAFEKKLKAQECFSSVGRGDTTTEKNDAKRVTLTIEVKESCR